MQQFKNAVLDRLNPLMGNADRAQADVFWADVMLPLLSGAENRSATALLEHVYARDAKRPLEIAQRYAQSGRVELALQESGLLRNMVHDAVVYERGMLEKGLMTTSALRFLPVLNQVMALPDFLGAAVVGEQVHNAAKRAIESESRAAEDALTLIIKQASQHIPDVTLTEQAAVPQQTTLQ